MAPNQDNNGNEETLPNRYRQRQLRPLSLCLSDNEKNMPTLTVSTTEETSYTNVKNCRVFK